VTDKLPVDLDVTRARPYKVPDIRRRRLAGGLHAGVAVACLGGFLASGNGGLLCAAGVLAAVAAGHAACAWPLEVDETAALAAAGREVDFPVGHASAQLAWRGLRSRPAWRVLLYSADEPPSRRGLVELDAVDGEVLGHYVEDNPEDWSAYGIGGGGDGFSGGGGEGGEGGEGGGASGGYSGGGVGDASGGEDGGGDQPSP
jgi:hypothetical protein